MNEFLIRSSLDQILLAIAVVDGDPASAVVLAKSGKSMVDQNVKWDSKTGTSPENDWNYEIQLLLPETHEEHVRVMQEAVDRARQEAGQHG